MAGEIDLATIRVPEVHARIEKSGHGGCWRWIGGGSANGYGYVSRGRSLPKLLAHRVVYTIFRGQIAAGMVLDHLCRNRRCVNPSHLQVVTVKENNARGFGASAVHARQTRCIRGHLFDAENTHITTSGSRRCRKCDRLREKARPSGWARARAKQERNPS